MEIDFSQVSLLFESDGVGLSESSGQLVYQSEGFAFLHGHARGDWYGFLGDEVFEPPLV